MDKFIAHVIGSDIPESLKHILKDFAFLAIVGPTCRKQASDILKQKDLRTNLIDQERHVLIQIIRRELLFLNRIRPANAKSGKPLTRRPAANQIQLTIIDIDSKILQYGCLKPIKHRLVKNQILDIRDIVVAQPRKFITPIKQVRTHGV